jgi:hypothetical protein
MSISCSLRVKKRFSDREKHEESIGEKTNSLAPSVGWLCAFQVLLVFMAFSHGNVTW